MNDNILKKLIFLDKIISYQIINYNGVRFEDYFDYYYLSRYLEKEIIKMYNQIANIENKETSKYIISSKTIPLKEKINTLENLLNSCNATINHINGTNLPYLEVLSK